MLVAMEVDNGGHIHGYRIIPVDTRRRVRKRSVRSMMTAYLYLRGVSLAVFVSTGLAGFVSLLEPFIS